MEAILVKVFATALALSQVATRPDTIKTQFDPVQDQAEVVQLLGAGCAHMRKAFDIENIDLDDLIATAMTDTRASANEIKGFRGLKFDELLQAYRQFCKNEPTEKSVVDVGQLIEFYNKAAADLPDHAKLKGIRLPGLTNVLDVKGAGYAELFEPDNRRHWVALRDIPVHVQQAFIAAEDKRFYKHQGIDERSVIRAFISMLGDPGRRQGGSTITQQVVKNLLVGDDVTYERKIREVIIASRLEQSLGKPEILEIYLNAIYLGRASWGIELAARSYFGKPAKELSLAEGAFLAGLAKGPSYYNPDRQRARAQERLAYVLGRMQEDGTIDASQMKEALAARLALAAYSRPRRDTGFHVVDQIGREAKAMAGIESLTASSYAVRSTILPQLQWAAEAALQEGLARYEQSTGRAQFKGPEANLTEAIKKQQADPNADRAKPAWLQALLAVRLPLYDVHWMPAVVLERARLQGQYESIRVGLRDGRMLPLSTPSSQARNALAINDVVYVSVFDGKSKDGKLQEGTRVELRVRPTVQAAAVVLENRTGRVLAMVGGFSYPLSQLNRATQSRRQPGSALKPLTYLAALGSGLQPNTLIQDAPITLPPIGASTRYAQDKDWWSPKNYDGNYSGAMTLRRALENSKNLATVHLLDGGIAATPQQSLDRVCRLATEAQLYAQCERYYPFVLGAQAVRPIDLAAFYATVANEGARPTPHVIESIEQDGRTVYRHTPSPAWLGSVDRPAVYQLKTLLQGVLARGTARSLSALSPFLGGKTGTSDEENDAWFVGFSNDVTIAVWVGYDNARGKRTLGPGQTGSKVALPIFAPIMQAVWETHAPKTALRGPSPEAQRQLIALPIDLRTGERLTNGNRGAFMENFRLDPTGRFMETQHRLVSRESSYTVGSNDAWSRPLYDPDPYSRNYRSDPDSYSRGYRREQDSTPYFALPRRDDPRLYVQPAPHSWGSNTYEERAQPRQRRVDPDYFGGNRHRLY
jgi:1A family penicillin-binding protein